MAQLRELPANVAAPVRRADVSLPADDAAPVLYEKQAELDIVVQDMLRCDSWIGTAWAQVWREADILYQALRYTAAFEGSQVQAPNVSRFTVAKLVNAVTPQIMKALFYQDRLFYAEWLSRHGGRNAEG